MKLFVQYRTRNVYRQQYLQAVFHAIEDQAVEVGRQQPATEYENLGPHADALEHLQQQAEREEGEDQVEYQGRLVHRLAQNAERGKDQRPDDAGGGGRELAGVDAVMPVEYLARQRQVDVGVIEGVEKRSAIERDDRQHQQEHRGQEQQPRQSAIRKLSLCREGDQGLGFHSAAIQFNTSM